MPAALETAPVSGDVDAAVAFDRLDAWLRAAAWQSFDVCDVRDHPVFRRARSASRRGGVAALATAPLNRLAHRHKNAVRRVLRVKPRSFAQAFAVGARGYFARARATGDPKWVARGRVCLDWLASQPAPGYDAPCWGQPYDWPSVRFIPAGTPRTTVTSIALQAFLDGYEVTGDPVYRDIAQRVIPFYTRVLPRREDASGGVCFAYTAIDDMFVHNANVVGAAALMRAARLVNDSEAEALAERSFAFTVDQQNLDGSWYYWALPAPPSRIDHYHTGFVLEALADARAVWPGRFPHAQRMQDGAAFYRDHLFDPDGAPRMRPDSRDPVDIQSCAQAILTWCAMAPHGLTTGTEAQRAWTWTAGHMRNRDGSFAYRLTKRGIDRTPYVRWGQAWMLRALGEMEAGRSADTGGRDA